MEDPEIEKTILKKDELRVGLLLPLSGSDSFLGNALLKSAQMAIFDNKNDEIYLYPLDTKGNPQGARKAAKKAIEHDVHIIIVLHFLEEVDVDLFCVVQPTSPLLNFNDIFLGVVFGF